MEEVISIENVSEALGLASSSWEIAKYSSDLVPHEAQLVYDDQIVFPALIYKKNLELLKAVVMLSDYLKNEVYNDSLFLFYTTQARDRLVDLRSTLDQGSAWKKWDGWTKPENFRVHTPPPAIEYFDSIIQKYK